MEPSGSQLICLLKLKYPKLKTSNQKTKQHTFSLAVLSDAYNLEGAEVVVKHEIPKFVGMGYHTTLALSIGSALAKLYGLKLTTEEIALTMKRGAITSLGVHAFKVGGFIVEGGFRVKRTGKNDSSPYFPSRDARQLAIRHRHSQRTARENR